MSDSLSVRGQALEGAFFQKKDRELLQRLREECAAEDKRAALSRSSGITDDQVLQRLVELEIEPASFASFAMLPLIQVAWADGKMQSAEREAILSAAEQTGIARDTTPFEVLESWLEESPGEDLYEAWKLYAARLKDSLEAAEVSSLQNRVLGRAREVAEAAGGILGFGNKVSDEEAEVLEQLAAAF